MEKLYPTIPLLPEFYELFETAGEGRDVVKDVIINSLLGFAETESTHHAELCLPGYLLEPFMKYVDVLMKYWKRRGQ